MSSAGSQRIDVWLWRARFYKTRSSAAACVRLHGVRISTGSRIRRTDRPATPVAIGDIVTFTKGGSIISVEITDFGSRRGPASEALSLYRPLESSP